MNLRSLMPAMALTPAMLTPVYAGGGPENLLIIADPTDEFSIYAANYYRDARNIPPQNVLFIEPGATDYAEFVNINLSALTGSITTRGLDDHIDFILVMPSIDVYRVSAPGLVSDPCPGAISNFSIGACYTSAFIADDILAGGMRHSETNRYFAGSDDPPAFDSNTAYLGGFPSTSSNARRYYIGAALGYKGLRGNSLGQTFAMVDRSVAADGTFPQGTFYYMNNAADPARNVRQSQFNSAITSLADVGATGEIINGALPLGRHDCLGVMSGFASELVVLADLTLMPGAFADHLTSFAATFGAGQQTKVSEWITRGASGSLGTVEEPCNYTGKFPRAKFHANYAQGMTLGEAAFRSLSFFPFQGLIYGDPLTRPFAHIPDVSVPDAPGAPVSGSVNLTPQATTSHPTASIDAYELLIDGVSQQVILPGAMFTIDTTLLAEGVHDIRVLAYDDTSIRTVGRWLGALDVDNTPHTADIAVNTPTGNYVTPFEFTISASGAPIDRVLLWQSGRVIGSSQTTAAPITVHGRLLGAGPASVSAEVFFNDGASAMTPPVQLDIDHAEGAVAGAPLAYDYTRTVSPDFPALLELPSTFSDLLTDATWTVSTPPAQATMLNTVGPYRVIQPDANASGTDTLEFSVTTPSGTSATATITIVYTSTPCPADLAPPFGTLDFSDVLAFLVAFSTGSPDADFAEPTGVFDFSDVLGYLTSFAAGCP